MSGPSVRSQGGFAILYAFVGLIFVSTLFYFLSDYLLLLGKQTNRKVNLTQGRMVIHSFMDYTVYGIKQRWCFDDAWLPAGSNLCTIENARSVERLIMSDDSIRIYNEMGALKSPAAPVLQPLRTFSHNVDLTGMLPAHPLYQIIQAARVTVPMTSIEVTLARDTRPQMPVGGRQMFLRLSMRVMNGTQPVIWQGFELKGKVDLVVAPRELGTFSLIAGNDLLLNQAYNATVPLGDLTIHQFGSRSETTGWPGLVFESPVFVNGTVVLPDSPPENAPRDPHYAAVTFADKVFVGSGQISRNGRRFKPKTAGDMNDQLWTQVREFGGFQRGVELDAAVDRGLEVLTNRRAVNALDEDFMRQCIDLVSSRSRLSYSSDSHVASVPVPGGTIGAGGIVQRLGFSRPNWIIPQEMNGGSGNSGNGNSGPGNGNGNNNAPPGPLGRFRMTMTNPRTGQNFEFGGNTGVALAAGQTATFNYSPPRSPEIREREIEKAGIEAAIVAAQLLAPIDAALLAALRAQLRVVVDRIDFLEEVDRRNGNITLTVEAPRAQAVMFADLRINTSTANLLVNSEGTPIAFDIETTLFDVGCDRGNCRENRNSYLKNSNRQDDRDFYGREIAGPGFSQRGVLNFTVNAGVLTSPAGAMSAGQMRSDIAPRDPAYWEDLETACTYSPRLAFGGADWGTSFLDSTFKSWNFAPMNPALTSIDSYERGPAFNWDGNNAIAGLNAAFYVRSLVNQCIIRSTARFVTGFFNCRELIIEQRDTPLRIIGTFIVAKLSIHPTAYRYGIRWSSIYHSTATQELIAARVLQPQAGNCQNSLNSPIWHPFPSMINIANNYKCNVVSLRNKADPFTWTTVEPDCGLLAVADRRLPTDAANTKCKNRVVRAVIFEMSRESAL